MRLAVTLVDPRQRRSMSVMLHAAPATPVADIAADLARLADPGQRDQERSVSGGSAGGEALVPTPLARWTRGPLPPSARPGPAVVPLYVDGGRLAPRPSLLCLCR